MAEDGLRALSARQRALEAQTEGHLSPTEGLSVRQGPSSLTEGPYDRQRALKIGRGETGGYSLPDRGLSEPDRGPSQLDRGPSQPDRGPSQPDRGPSSLTEGPHGRQRALTVDRGPSKLAEGGLRALSARQGGPFSPTEGPFSLTEGPLSPDRGPLSPTEGP